MPKKNSSKVSFATKEESNTKQNPPKKTHEVDLKRKKPEPEKSADTNNQPKKGKQKKSDEIDEIFAALKKRKTEQTKANKSGDTKDKLKKISKVSNESEAFNTDSNPRRRTNDGLVIYSAEELGINKKDAGQTALCPFDCSCCF